MYFIVVITLLLLFPAASVIGEIILHPHTETIMSLTGKWFVFWAAGVRLFIAGIRQVIQPRFTAIEIFGIQDEKSFAIVREIGFGNLAMGILAICSLFRPAWIVPAALAGGLYYGFAGIGHLFTTAKNAKEYTAMVSDGFIFAVLLVFVWNSFV